MTDRHWPVDFLELGRVMESLGTPIQGCRVKAYAPVVYEIIDCPPCPLIEPAASVDRRVVHLFSGVRRKPSSIVWLCFCERASLVTVQDPEWRANGTILHCTRGDKASEDVGVWKSEYGSRHRYSRHLSMTTQLPKTEHQLFHHPAQP